jgi:TfoX/Sxy family transcriptional regulator of competence genes
MAFDEKLAERVRQLFQQRNIAFEEKRMMGGLCFMVDDKMCFGVHEQRLMARIDPEAYESALRRKGCTPMDFTGRPMRGFVFVQPEGLATKRDLKSWLELALDFNPRAVSSKRNKARTKRNRSI